MRHVQFLPAAPPPLRHSFPEGLNQHLTVPLAVRPGLDRRFVRLARPCISRLTFGCMADCARDTFLLAAGMRVVINVGMPRDRFLVSPYYAVVDEVQVV